METPYVDYASLDLSAKYYVVKITISMLHYPGIPEDTVYYRRQMPLDFFIRWAWYFEYLAARVKVSNPRRRVVLFAGRDEWLAEEEEKEKKTASLLKARLAQIKRLKNEVVVDDLFGFTSEEHRRKISRVEQSVERLNKGTEDVFYMPEHKNNIKKWIK